MPKESFSLARQLASEGVTLVAATPHSYGFKKGHPYSPTRFIELVKEARRKFLDYAIPLKIIAGTEILLGPNTIEQLHRRRLLCYENTNTLLLETSAYISLDELGHAVRSIQEMGYRVMLAHPEKMEIVQDNPFILKPLIERGLLTQVTAANLVGMNGALRKKTSEQLITNAMAHIIASDAHAAEGPRAPFMKEGHRTVKQHLGMIADSLFVSTPNSILNTDNIPE